MNTISNIFKSKTRRDCENAFTFLEESGFAKSYGKYGVEATLIYQKDDTKISLTWELPNGNPWFRIQTSDSEVYLENFEEEIRNRYPFIKPGNENFRTYVYDVLNRKEFLNLIKEKIKNVLQQRL